MSPVKYKVKRPIPPHQIDPKPYQETYSTLAYPFFVLKNQCDTRDIEFCGKDGFVTRISPGKNGLPNMFDKDIVVYAISIAVRTGERDVEFLARDFLDETGRSFSGFHYMSFKKSLSKLLDIKIETNLRSGKNAKTSNCGKRIIRNAMSSEHLLHEIYIEETESKKTGKRVTAIKVRLSNFLWNAVKDKSDILTLSSQYFAIKKPYEKRLYEVARQFCGNSDESKSLSIDILQQRMGAKTSEKLFKYTLKKICRNNNLPDYDVEMRENTRKIAFSFNPGKDYNPNP